MPIKLVVESLIHNLSLDPREADRIARKVADLPDVTRGDSLSAIPPGVSRSFHDFLAAALSSRYRLRRQDALQVFRRFDVDDSGELSFKDLSSVLGPE